MDQSMLETDWLEQLLVMDSSQVSCCDEYLGYSSITPFMLLVLTRLVVHFRWTACIGSSPTTDRPRRQTRGDSSQRRPGLLDPSPTPPFPLFSRYRVPTRQLTLRT